MAGKSSPTTHLDPLPPLLQEAVRAHEHRQFDEAAPLYRRFLAQNPTHPTALQLLGLLHSQTGEYDTAIALMQESLRQYPEQAEVANNLGNALSASGRYEAAVASYTQAIKLNPRYGVAIRNLGLCLLELNRPDKAAPCFEKCIELDPGDAAAWMGLGNVFRSGDNIDEAIRCYREAIAIRPDYAEAYHNLGVCLRAGMQPREALQHLDRAAELGLDRAEVHYNRGNALVDVLEIDAAIDAFRAAVERNPEDIVSHRNLNTLLWEEERLDEYLQSYRQALLRRPDSVALCSAYALVLDQLERYEEAERVLQEGLRRAPGESRLKTLLAYAYEGQDQWDKALAMHAETVDTPGSIADHRTSFARALLACQRPDEALVQARQAAGETPFNQRALAYLGLCWRVLGDERDVILNDYETYVQVYDLPVPKAFHDTKAFNQRLRQYLLTLHTGKRHPPEQTLRGGTQTHGNLFNRVEPEIRGLISALNECVRDYVRRLGHDPNHPLLSRRDKGFNYAASWSVRLARCGYHTMHVHPLGWISSAYYVNVPESISGSDAYGGGIKFGQPDIDLGETGNARRSIQPRTGQLVLFPSYMWHGTVPHQSEEDRMTVAFDVVPDQERPRSG